jgi:hypothetical protein
VELLGGRLLLSEPVPWVLGSLALAILVANLGWLVVRKIRTREAGRRILRWSGLPALSWLWVSLYLLLPPLAAWSYGTLSLYFLGLAEVNWLESLAAGGLLTGLIAALAAFGWAIYCTSRRPDPKDPQKPLDPKLRWLAPVDAALQQWHWAFYRAAMAGGLASLAGKEANVVEMLQEAGTNAAFLESGGLASTVVHAAGSQTLIFLRALLDQPLYWGSWLGLALVAIECSLNPFARADLRSSGRMELSLLRVGLAIATTALFTLTRNLWLCLVCQVIAETAIVSAPLPAPNATKDE